jgi:geranylgeranyl diphosphate synthase type I
MQPLVHTETSAAEDAALLLGRVESSLNVALDDEVRRWRTVDPAVAELTETIRAFVLNGGKRLRPAFCVWGYLGAGGDPEDDAIVSLAAAVELLHAFALIHDDVMDDADTRRGRPSVHRHFMNWGPRRFGEGMAILAGDLAHMLAERELIDLPANVRAYWYEMQVELTRGQALDMLHATRARIGRDDARRVATLKSGRYTVVRPLVLGALAANRADLEASYCAFGEPLGEAFQLRDDLLGAFGTEDQTGKPVGDDLREGKPTYLLACAQELACGADARLLRRCGDSELDDLTIRRIQHVLDRVGARAEVEARVSSLEEQSVEALAAAAIPDDVRDGLRALATAAVWRHA